MTHNTDIVVDFIARTDDPNIWKMVLVEQGPWKGDSELELRRIQDRLYGCIDAAIDGKLAEQFPETIGKLVLIQLDCYDLPEIEIRDLFKDFSKNVFSIPGYKSALAKSQFVIGIDFEINFE